MIASIAYSKHFVIFIYNTWVNHTTECAWYKDEKKTQEGSKMHDGEAGANSKFGGLFSLHDLKMKRNFDVEVSLGPVYV